jgi:hypothetical protein
MGSNGSSNGVKKGRALLRVETELDINDQLTTPEEHHPLVSSFTSVGEPHDDHDPWLKLGVDGFTIQTN